MAALRRPGGSVAALRRCWRHSGGIKVAGGGTVILMVAQLARQRFVSLVIGSLEALEDPMQHFILRSQM